MGLEAALERPGSMPGTLAIMEGAEIVGRILTSDHLLERICDQLLGHVSKHRPKPITFLRNASITAARQRVAAFGFGHAQDSACLPDGAELAPMLFEELAPHAWS